MLFEEISHLSEKSHRRYQDDFVNSSYIDCWHLKCLVVKKWEAGRLVASLIIRTHNQSNVRIRQPILSPEKKNSDYVHWSKLYINLIENIQNIRNNISFLDLKKLAKLDSKLLFRKSREDSFVEIYKKKVGEDTVPLHLR